MDGDYPMETKRQCTARARSGARCRRRPIPGGQVCVMHGGGAPQVRASAQQRLATLVEPALDRLSTLLRGKHPAVALGAAKDVLDRNGLKAPQKVEVASASIGPSDIELSRLTDEELLVLMAAIKIRAGFRGGDDDPSFPLSADDFRRAVLAAKQMEADERRQ